MSRISTHDSKKRNLSSSYSTKQYTSLKKSNAFVSSNRFSCLSVDVTPFPPREVFCPPPITVSPTTQYENINIYMNITRHFGVDVNELAN